MKHERADESDHVAQNWQLLLKRKKLCMNGYQKPVKAEVQKDHFQEQVQKHEQEQEHEQDQDQDQDQEQEQEQDHDQEQDQEQEQKQEQEQEQEQVQEQTNKCVCIYLINKYYCENCKNKKNT